MTTIRFKRGTRSKLNQLALKGALLEGEPLYITDETTLAIATAPNNFVDVGSNSASVKTFGAVGDGITADDAAFALMEASSLDSFFLPDGLFKLTSINLLEKKYWGTGSIQFADGYTQSGVSFSDALPRNHIGNRVLDSPADIVLAPNGNVQFAGKRILNVGDPVGQNDAVNLQYAQSLLNNFPIYSKGTFTPVIRGTTGAGTATYTLQAGTWYKIGDLVTVRVRLSWSGHTGTGAYSIPWTLFPPGNGGVSPPGNIILTGDWSGLSGAGTLYCYITNGLIFPARDYQNGANDAPVTLQASGSLDLIITYEV